MTPEPQMSPEWQKIQQMLSQQVERMAKQELMFMDGFAAAFLDATGLKPQEAQMFIEEKGVSDNISGEHKLVRRIWFEKRVG